MPIFKVIVGDAPPKRAALRTREELWRLRQQAAQKKLTNDPKRAHFRAVAKAIAGPEGWRELYEELWRKNGVVP